MKKYILTTLIFFSFGLLYGQNPSLYWHISGDGAERLVEFIPLNNDAIVVGGIYNEDFMMDTFTIPTVGGDDFFLCKYNTDQEVDWVFHAGSIYDDELWSLNIDSEGNFWISGGYWVEMSIGDTTLVAQRSAKNAFAARISPDGEMNYIINVSGSGEKDIHDISIYDDFVILNGYFSDTLQIDDAIVTAIGEQDVYAAKIAPGRDNVILKNWGFSGKNRAKRAKKLDNEAFIVAGTMSDSLIIGQDTIHVNTFDRDVFVAAIDTSLNGIWAKRAGGVIDDDINDIAIKADSMIAISGFFTGVLSAGDAWSISSQSGLPDAYTFLLDRNGESPSGRSWGSDDNEQIKSIFSLPHGWLMTGSYSTAFNIDEQSLPATDNLAGFAGLFSEDLNNKKLWALQSDGFVFPSQTYVMEIDSSIYIGGSFGGTMSLENDNLIGNGNTDIFILKYGSFLLPNKEIHVENASSRIYPNPVNGDLFLETNQELIAIDLWSLDGKRIRSWTKNERTLDMNGVSSGTYFLRLLSKNGSINILKVVVS